MKIEMPLAEVFRMIIRSVEIGKPDNAKAIAEDALNQIEAEEKKQA